MPTHPPSPPYARSTATILSGRRPRARAAASPPNEFVGACRPPLPPRHPHPTPPAPCPSLPAPPLPPIRPSFTAHTHKANTARTLRSPASRRSSRCMPPVRPTGPPTGASLLLRWGASGKGSGAGASVCCFLRPPPSLAGLSSATSSASPNACGPLALPAAATLRGEARVQVDAGRGERGGGGRGGLTCRFGEYLVHALPQ